LSHSVRAPGPADVLPCAGDRFAVAVAADAFIVPYTHEPAHWISEVKLGTLRGFRRQASRPFALVHWSRPVFQVGLPQRRSKSHQPQGWSRFDETT